MLGNSANKTGNINIGNGYDSTGTIYLGINTTTTIISGTVSIGSDVSVPLTLYGITMANDIECNNIDAQNSNLNIGGDSTLSTSTSIGSGVNPTSILGSSITLNNPLTLANQIPTPGTNLLGNKYATMTITWSATAGGVIATTPALPIGVYLMDFSISLSNTFTQNYLRFPVSASEVRFTFVQISSTNPTSVCAGMKVFNSTSPTTYSLYVGLANSNTLEFGFWDVWRIG